MSDSQHPFKMPGRSIRTFVWDFADEGIHEVLERLAESGVDGVHLALAYHGGRFYCPHNPKHTLVHAPDGVLYFQPLLSCYESIQPRVHPEYGSGAFVARLRDAVHEYEMAFTAWIVLCNNMTLSMAYPETNCVNATGDRLEGALCPSNPDVRVYAQALIEDLAHRVGVDVIELEDFAFPPHHSYVGTIWQGASIGPGLGYLLSLCFCEHCRRRAEEVNMEVDDLIYHVERMIRAGLTGDMTDRRICDEIADPYTPVSRYAEVRAETVKTLLDELIEATEGSHVMALQLILREEPDDAWRWGQELHALRQRRLHATLQTESSASATSAFIGRYLDLLQLGHNLAADISLSVPEREDYTPAATIEACMEAGLERFVFSHYGLAPLDMLDWIGALARSR